MRPELVEIIAWSAWTIGVWETIRSLRAARSAEPVGYWRWCAALVITFLAFRWPYWTDTQEHSVDESQGLAGALTLWTDPLFWRSVDGNTAGPLHYYLLMPSTLWPGSNVFFVARLIGYSLVLGTLFLTGRILARVAPRGIERATVLIATSALAFSDVLDNQHTSTEVLPMFLMAAAVAFYLHPERRRRDLWLTGLALGLVPWAKLQAAPIALGLGLAAVCAECYRTRYSSATTLVGTALLPSLGVAGVLTFTNTWPDMVIPYLLKNTQYFDESLYSTSLAWTEFFKSLFRDEAGTWIIAGGLLVVATQISRLRTSPELRVVSVLAHGWLVLALLCVLAARRPFFHYWYLVIAPWTLVVGVTLEKARSLLASRQTPHANRVFVALVTLMLIPLVAYRVLVPARDADVRHIFKVWHSQDAATASLVKSRIKPGDRLVIWGWRSGLYLALDLPQGTRQAHSEPQLTSGPFQAYFLRTYWEDFQANRPAVFIDAVGPTNFMFENRQWAHECFPQLAQAIRRNYTLLREQFGLRLYLRNDRLSDSAQ